MPATPPYTTPEDVRVALGSLGSEARLPDAIDLEERVAAAHAEALDRLAETYGPTLPAFAGDGLEAIRWAEAKIAAAEILDILRASLGDDSLIPERLRTSAYRTLDRGVPGYRPGQIATPVPDEDDPAIPSDPGLPRHSAAAHSIFASPYADTVIVEERVSAGGVVALPYGTDTSYLPEGTIVVFY